MIIDLAEMNMQLQGRTYRKKILPIFIMSKTKKTNQTRIRVTHTKSENIYRYLWNHQIIN